MKVILNLNVGDSSFGDKFGQIGIGGGRVGGI